MARTSVRDRYVVVVPGAVLSAHGPYLSRERAEQERDRIRLVPGCWSASVVTLESGPIRLSDYRGAA